MTGYTILNNSIVAMSYNSLELSKKALRNIERANSLLAGGLPKYVRCYDLPNTADRYTVVFTGHYPKGEGHRKYYLYLGMNSMPFHPQGIGLHGGSPDGPIDRPTSSHLGKRIKFTDLPEDCQKFVVQTYKEIWSL